ncbi:MAG: DUF488 family protein [Bifidobacterium aquikefiri]|uniref:Uroporphyrin-III C-methyltransferase n=3 Tax=Bifidobacterium TaxID=1678 RepID=A0A261GBJ3_9BIFI|nr:DUF488 family protein [Bifidobacterium aquikefiri]OZG68780.1 uroporphyrin-III C-methyltransferase [Bifidobacterium aquikefiri]
MEHGIRIERVYSLAPGETGYRILVDRLWPRGISKAKLALDFWAKDLAPTPELRKWFSHRADRFEEFQTRYLAQLDAYDGANNFCTMCSDVLRNHDVLLLYAAKDEHNNQAVVLQAWLRQRLHR